MFTTDDRSRKLATLAISCIGLFMVLLDASIVTVALPTIQRNLSAGISGLQWVVDGYTLSFAVLLLAAGTFGDRFGRKRVYLVGILVFTLGSLFCGVAPSLGALIAGRVIQGIGGAALSTGSGSLLAAAFPDPRERAQAIGIWSGVSGIALAAGPLAGGLLIQAFDWQAIFFLNLPIGGLALAAGLSLLAESRNPLARRLDIPGLLTSSAALAALTFALIQGESQGWGSPVIVGLFASTVLLLVAFLVAELRTVEPMFPLDLFTNPIFSAANVAAVAVGFALLGTVFFVAQYFQEVQGYTALQSGLRTLPNTIGIFIVAPLAGRITARFGPRLPIVCGALLAGIALLLLTRIQPDTAYGAIWWNLGLCGVGFGFMLSPISAAVFSTIPSNRVGLGSSVVNTSRQIGSVLGVALLGAVVQAQFADRLTTELTALGIQGRASAGIATTVSGSGATAGQLLPSLLAAARAHVTPSAVQAAVGNAFTQALHPSFVISAILLLAVALVTFGALRVRPRAVARSAPAGVPGEGGVAAAEIG
jgi:DHA2 family methylenomycin A resistance protein-like MFS transporter